MKHTPDSFTAHHPVLPSLLSQPTYTGRTGKEHNSNANSTVSNLHIIHDFLEREKPKNTLEIGLAFAMSGIVFAHYQQRQRSLTKAAHTHSN